MRAVIAESFERIHRSNLVGMGVLPLQFKEEGWQKLGLNGEEIVSIRGLENLSPRTTLTVELYRPTDGRIARFPVVCRIDTPTELEYFKNGGGAELRPAQPRESAGSGGIALRACSPACGGAVQEGLRGRSAAMRHAPPPLSGVPLPRQRGRTRPSHKQNCYGRPRAFSA